MSPATWYVARSAGVVAYVLLSTSVVVGITMSTRARLAWPRFAVQEIHRFLAILTAVFLLLHGAALLLDRVVPLSLLQAIVPFTNTYRPFAVGLGVTAMLLLAAVGLTNAVRARLPYTVWRRVHYATFAVWLLSTAHALLAGTDRHDIWFLGVLALTVGTVSVALVARFFPADGEAETGAARIVG